MWSRLLMKCEDALPKKGIAAKDVFDYLFHAGNLVYTFADFLCLLLYSSSAVIIFKPQRTRSISQRAQRKPEPPGLKKCLIEKSRVIVSAVKQSLL